MSWKIDSTTIRVNTYAELCGNTKKEPIKNGSGNKLITGDVGLAKIDAVFNKALGIANNEQVGVALENINKALMPLANDNRLSAIAEQVSPLSDIPVGIENAHSISNYRASTG